MMSKKHSLLSPSCSFDRGGFVSRGIIGMAYPSLLPRGRTVRWDSKSFDDDDDDDDDGH